MKNLKIYAILLVLAVAFSLNSCSSGTSAPGDAIVKAYDFMKNKEFEKAAKMYISAKGEKFTDAETKKMEGLAAMAYEQHKKKDGIKIVEITEETIAEDGKSAKIKFTVHFNNGDTDNEKADLLKIDGKWFIKV
jgi:type IV pilus biogenesis protein CpaD/CtpE